MFSSLIRRRIYWMLDLIKGSKVKKHYLDIKSIMEKPYNEQKKIQLFYLNNLMNHAVVTTNYYKNYKGLSLNEFPVINKQIIKDNINDFLSTKYLNVKKHSMSTSGSTGTPFVVQQNMNKRYRTLADLIYFNEIAGQNIGDRFVFFRVWTQEDLHTVQNSKFKMFAKNEVPVDISKLDDQSMEEIRQLLKKDKKINEIMGYASTHKRLGQYLDKCGDKPSDFNLKLIISGSEMLEISARNTLKKVFGCTVLSRYSNQENGVLGQQCSKNSDSEKYHMNVASYYIELLKIDSDEPAEIGEVGRIVVTDLFNYAMPMIRYDTGDLAIKTNACDCGYTSFILGNLQGRLSDVCRDTNGNLISPLLLDKHMEKFDKLKQFQFIQNDINEYIFKVNDPNNEYLDEQFIDLLKELLGNDANCKIIRVNEIPCLNSGKFKQMICNLKD